MLAAFAALAVGFAVLWANPKRIINRVFFSTSLHVALWLLFFELAVSGDEGLVWLRMATAVGALFPAHLWIMKESVRESGGRFLGIRHWWYAALLGGGLAWICFTGWFIPHHSTPELRLRGWGYYTYMIGANVLYLVLCVQTIMQARSTTGVRKIELQVLLLGGCAASFTVIGLMVLNAITHNLIYIKLQPLVVFVFYSGTAWAMITSRVFDARHILYIGLQKLFLIFTVALFIWTANELLVMLIPRTLSFVAAVGLGLWFASKAGSWFELLFDLNLRGEDARRIAFETSRRESRPDNMETAFVRLLKGWSKSDQAHVLMYANGQFRGKEMLLPADGHILTALRALQWATPERLTRQKSGKYEQELQRFMEKEQLGVMMVTSGQELVLAVGIPASRRPFTYPQVAQLFELASIIESAMERSQFSVKAQQAEQLATVGLMGAGLAHEIRNPLVTIKTFVQLLPDHYGDPIFREKFFHLIGEEVSRIDALTEQLLDMATPRTYVADKMGMHALLDTSLELIAAKAADQRIRIEKVYQAAPDQVLTDATAVKQVLLNLCFNAIQAMETKEGDRWIKVTTRNLGPEFIEVSLEDSGVGVDPAMLPRLFKPFQSTKSTGFGLGLAICSDILSGLKATIAVDLPIPGRGATFRLKFPCQAS